MGRTVEEDLGKRFPAEKILVETIQAEMPNLNHGVRETFENLVRHIRFWMLEERDQQNLAEAIGRGRLRTPAGTYELLRKLYESSDKPMRHPPMVWSWNRRLENVELGPVVRQGVSGEENIQLMSLKVDRHIRGNPSFTTIYTVAVAMDDGLVSWVADVDPTLRSLGMRTPRPTLRELGYLIRSAQQAFAPADRP